MPRDAQRRSAVDAPLRSCRYLDNQGRPRSPDRWLTTPRAQAVRWAESDRLGAASRGSRGLLALRSTAGLWVDVEFSGSQRIVQPSSAFIMSVENRQVEG